MHSTAAVEGWGLEVLVGVYGVAVGEAGVAAEPVLERYLEAEALAEVLGEEGAEVLRAHKVGDDDIVQGSGDLPVDACPLGGPGLGGGGQLGEGGADEEAEVVAVVHIGDIEVVAGAGIGGTKDHFFEEGLAGVGDFDVEVVVADEAEEDAVAVDAVVTHHLFDGDFSSAGALVNYELDEVCAAGHGLWVGWVGWVELANILIFGENEGRNERGMC